MKKLYGEKRRAVSGFKEGLSEIIEEEKNNIETHKQAIEVPILFSLLSSLFFPSPVPSLSSPSSLFPLFTSRCSSKR